MDYRRRCEHHERVDERIVTATDSHHTYIERVRKNFSQSPLQQLPLTSLAVVRHNDTRSRSSCAGDEQRATRALVEQADFAQY